MKNTFKQPIVIILIFLIGFLILNFLKVWTLDVIVDQGYDTIDSKHIIIIIFNTLYALISYWLIKKYRLIDLAGLGKHVKFKNWFLLLLPLYLVLINIPEPGDINFEGITMLNYILLGLWALSVGLSEELMLRGFVQSLLLSKYGNTKKGIFFSVIGGAMLFGILHLVKFDKGLYGEIAQLLFATFIGTMFGAILLRTQKLWPLIVMHALIDVVGNLDKLEPLKETTETAVSNYTLENSIVLVLVVFPCFIYGLILLKKVKVDQVTMANKL